MHVNIASVYLDILFPPTWSIILGQAPCFLMLMVFLKALECLPAVWLLSDLFNPLHVSVLLGTPAVVKVYVLTHWLPDPSIMECVYS